MAQQGDKILKIKFIKPTKFQDQDYPIDTVVEIDDQATVDALIADGSAVAYTEETEAEEADKANADMANAIVEKAKEIQVEQKSFKATEKTVAKGVKNMKGLIGKSVSGLHMERKTVDAVAGVTATEYIGYAVGSNKLWDKFTKMAVNGNLRAVYANTVPTISTVGEGGANAQSAIPIAKNATQIKKFASFSVPKEYFEDVDGLDAYLSTGVGDYVRKAVFGEILAGDQTGATIAGCESIAASGDMVKATFVSLTAPTKAELLAMKNLVHPDLRDNTMFVVNPSFWAGCESVLLDSGNIGAQLITIGANPTMFGYPVIVTEKATTPICGDFTRYIVGIGRDLEITQQDNVATDSVITGVGMRVAGAIAWKKDATYAAFVTAVVAG